MKKKILLIALAGALAAPSAHAATDTSGMRYTSAAEGFYASIRAQFNSGENDGDGPAIENSASRIGVRGSSDIGGGGEFFYRYEMGVSIDNGGSVGTRLANVGLRGKYGQIKAGSMWPQSYNWVYGSTDIAHKGSGNFIYNDRHPGRINHALEYTTPARNGFRAAVLAVIDDTSTPGVPAYPTLRATRNSFTVVTVPAEPPESDKRNIDKMIYAVGYAHDNGFSAGAYYSQTPKVFFERSSVLYSDTASVVLSTGLSGKKDYKVYAAKLGYAGDDWYINAWIGRDNSSGSSKNVRILGNDRGVDIKPDCRVTSVAGGVRVGKVDVYAMWETQTRGTYTLNVEQRQTQHPLDSSQIITYNVVTLEDKKFRDTYALFGVQYRFNEQARLWVDYVDPNTGSDSTTKGYFIIGLRHDF